VASALTNAVTNYIYLREVRAALQLSPYNRTYLRLIVPAMMSLGVTFSVKFPVRHLQPQWLWIGITLMISYATFCGLSLLFGLDDDDRMIVTAIRGRVQATIGKFRSS
jgi:hypothetical protein